MKKSSCWSFAFLMFLFSWIPCAAGMEEECSDCYGQACDICGDPWNDPDCFGQHYNPCVARCCSDECNQYALDECEISAPSENPECYEPAYQGCLEDDEWGGCCEGECYMQFEGCYWDCQEPCHHDCDDSCAEDCGQQCGANETCMGTCMDNCLYGEDEAGGCYGSCDENCQVICQDLADSCYDECIQGGGSGDSDGDNISNDEDNCPFAYNPGQEDNDGDGIGNICDNCPQISNADQADNDHDCDGNACDLCPDTFSNRPYEDTDQDGIGDACDTDIDDDNITNESDNCPYVSNSDQSDSDYDGVGDACDMVNRHLESNEYSVMDPVMKYAADIELPDHDAQEETLYPEVSPYYAYPFDLYTDLRSRTYIAGSFKPSDCQDIRDKVDNAWILGYNRDGDNTTDDSVRFQIISGGHETTSAAIWGMPSTTTFMGEYSTEGGISGYLGTRYYAPENGLWYYSFEPLNYPGSVYTGVWDSAYVEELGRTVYVGRYEDNQLRKMHGFIYSRHYNGQAMEEQWTTLNMPGADETYVHSINSRGEIVGYYNDANGTHHGFHFDGNSTFSIINAPGAVSTKFYRINNKGLIAGFFTDQNGHDHSFISSSDMTLFFSFDIRGAKDTRIFGIDDRNQVTGYFVDEAGSHPFVAMPLPCQADFDFDMDVDGDDLAALMVNYGNPVCATRLCTGDLDSNGKVNNADLAVLAEKFGRSQCYFY